MPDPHAALGAGGGAKPVVYAISIGVTAPLALTRDSVGIAAHTGKKPPS